MSYGRTSTRDEKGGVGELSHNCQMMSKKVTLIGIFLLLSLAHQRGFGNAETVTPTSTDSESCKKTEEGSPFTASSSSDSSGGCGCSGTSGGLKRDSALGSLDNGHKGETGTKEPASSSSSSSSATMSSNEDRHTPASLYSYNLDTMVYLEGGTFYMGTDHPKILTDGEGPKRLVTLSDFLIDKYEVSNDEYRKFVDSTGYRTESEFFGWSFVFESAVPPHLKAKITQAVLGAEWWLPVNGSYWREPEGPGTDVFLPHRYRGTLPAVQISWNDAVAFCRWRGGARLPTEAEWEYASRGSIARQVDNPQSASLYPWGNKLTPKGKHRTNIFQGTFPGNNLAEDGFEHLCPVDTSSTIPAQNDYGLHHMIGNAWEWVEDWFTQHHSPDPTTDPRGPPRGADKVKKGGSFLCHKSFCYRYRTAARYAATPDSATLNSGFRCAMDGLGASPRTMSVEDADRAKHNGQRGDANNNSHKSGSSREEDHEEL